MRTPEAIARSQEKRKATLAARPKSEPKPDTRTAEELADYWKTQRSRLRASYEDGDWLGFIEELSARCKHTPAECWEWQGKTTTPSPLKGKAPYPVLRWGRAHHFVHRLALEAKHGAPLGTQQSHHVCANTLCVNPAHLQAATHVENIAEMKARRSYEDRIKELEQALASVSPEHPALNRVAYGA